MVQYLRRVVGQATIQPKPLAAAVILGTTRMACIVTECPETRPCAATVERGYLAPGAPLPAVWPADSQRARLAPSPQHRAASQSPLLSPRASGHPPVTHPPPTTDHRPPPRLRGCAGGAERPGRAAAAQGAVGASVIGRAVLRA